MTTFAKLYGKNDGDFNTHEKNNYHRNAVLAAKDFLLTYAKPEVNIVNQLNTVCLQNVQENRSQLRPILKTILLLGRQNISFRGHRDDGAFKYESPVNQGNFKALLEYRTETDTDLKKTFRAVIF